MVYATFEQRAVRDEAASKTEGREILKDEDWVVLVIDQNTKTPKPALAWLADNERKAKENRMPPEEAKHYKACYDAWKEGREEPLNGTDVRHWSMISKATAENLRNVGVKTVEQFAIAPDNILRIIGMGAVDLQNKAKKYLEAADGKVAERMVDMEKQLRDQNRVINELREALAEKPQEKDKAKRGRAA